ncbi:uncharacterized protein (DUF934 family) [Panacagrimonas perspica]|uniref:Uncharacterized protein (DUF934 family) n=1 Tax=Panacagrimonas perspica TaxID=381431 RepID=A0A4S3JZX5_9GAMM|nr:DUF934 domain-containing protein [Panacagrimonas perspica]TDU32885.1 uncharacterized protein (DUF934 family) [Panacagrimonas perspica]THD00994.1 hypothetical protein B1810_22345 [Panacagrimonas perspica]
MSALLRVDGGSAITYAPIGDDDAVPENGAVLVSFARWERDRAQLDARKAPLAIQLPNTADIATIDPAVLKADLIVLQFPSFGDGRGYSQARLLRDARGYKGELRATGAAVVRDQLLGMVRCGIDSFELRADQSPESCMEALKDFSIAYQPPADDLPQIRSLRRRSMST